MDKTEKNVVRVNFNLPRKMFERMMDLSTNVLGIEAVSGAAKHFCITGFQMSVAQLTAARNSESAAAGNRAAVGMFDLFQGMTEAENLASASSLDTKGITRNGKTGKKAAVSVAKKKGHRMK
jgi:hypothetical protein